ncbi:MAG: SRPBCC domain-containing protein [Bdellovibrionota bacterium]
MQTSQDKPTQPTTHKNSTPVSPLLVIEREFSVPVSQLFQAFTTPKALKAWWWPQGLYADQVDIDFREGGEYFINMKGAADKGGGGMAGQFQEIVENERIVMTDNFADETGRAISAQEAKMPGEWPELVYITLEFSSTGENTSRFKLSQEGIPREMQKDCIQGWNESFDKLENYLVGRKH